MCDVFSLGNTVAPNISLLQLKKDDIYVLIVTSKNNKASSWEHELCCFIENASYLSIMEYIREHLPALKLNGSYIEIAPS